MTKEKEIEEEILYKIKHNPILGKGEGYCAEDIKIGIKEGFLAGQNSQKEKDLEMIDDFYNEFILNWNCKKDRVLIKQLYRGIKQKIKGDEE